MQKQREKAARKKERTEEGGEAPAAEGVTWYELVGEEGGARPWDAGAAAEQGEDVDGMRARLEAEQKAAERAVQERAAERERERERGRGGA
ncbi:MAG TPA: hypothetical protein VMT18_06465 [Planctomycetota bacterium]|nr:hypothetical protein [Planctomycetota bacterium]